MHRLGQQAPHETLTTSYIPPFQISSIPLSPQEHISETVMPSVHSVDGVTEIRTDPNSTGKGVLIGMLSAFGSAAIIAFILLVIYFFQYTQQGRILLDRLGRPGEFDDEQAFAREEAEALEEMDDMQRMEYLRARGTSLSFPECEKTANKL
jgi:hypothetical protein